MLVRIQMKHDIVCWMIAIGLHLLLFLMNFNLMRNIEPGKLVPIVEVEYLTPEDIISASRVGAPGEPPKTFKEKIKNFFRTKEVVPPKKEEVLAGKGPSELEVKKIGGLSQEETLIDKKGSLSRKVELSPITESKEKLISEAKEEQILPASKQPKLTDLKAQSLKDKEYKVAKKDLPFQVATKEEIRGNDIDVVDINLGKETSKGILTQAPTLEDIKGKVGKAEFGEGVFRVVKKEVQGKLSGTEVLANLLAMAKNEEAKKLQGDGYGSGRGSGGAIGGKEGYGEGGGGSALGSGGGEVAWDQGAGGGQGMGSGVGAGGESSTGMASKGSSAREVKSEQKGKERTFRKGMVFSHPHGKEGVQAGSTSGVTENKEVAKKEQKGRVIFEIMGPLSQRMVLYKDIPSYPEWAEKEGIEAGVSVHFVVLSNGKVKDNIYVVRTSGYPVIDNLVMEALRHWQFASLEGDLYGKEEWGVLTFYFSLGKESVSRVSRG